MISLRELLLRTAQRIADYREGLHARPVFPSIPTAVLREAFGRALPARGTDPEQVIDELVAAASPGLVSTSS